MLTILLFILAVIFGTYAIGAIIIASYTIITGIITLIVDINYYLIRIVKSTLDFLNKFVTKTR